MRIRVFKNKPIFLNTDTVRVECHNYPCSKCHFSTIDMPCRLLAAKHVIKNLTRKINELIRMYTGVLDEKDKN